MALRTIARVGVAVLAAVLFGADARAGKIDLYELPSAAVAGNAAGISNERRLLIYLPDGYESSGRWYPTIYWIPGWTNYATEEYRYALDDAIARGVIPPVIVVSLDAHEGFLFLNNSIFGRWEDFLFNEAIPYIDAHYRTMPNPLGRAIMGHSTGGYAAMILSARHPGVFGAAGANDASVWLGCELSMIRQMPTEFADYRMAPPVVQAFWQFGIAVTPNFRNPWRFDHPLMSPPIPGVAEAWEAHCLQRSETIARYKNAFAALEAIAVIVPDTIIGTNAIANLRMIDAMESQGLRPIQLDMPGEHDGHRNERFLELAKTVLPRLEQAREASDPLRSTEAETWGSLKTIRQ